MNNAFKKPHLESRDMKTLEFQARTAHFIDIENMSESSILTEEAVQKVKREYFEAVKPGEHDIFIIGVSHFNLSAATFGWGAGVAQYVVQSGQDGADLALAEAACDSCVTNRFSRVCIASGDNLLAGIGEFLKGEGILVRFAARRNCVARQILASGCEFILLPSLNVIEEYALVS